MPDAPYGANVTHIWVMGFVLNYSISIRIGLSKAYITIVKHRRNKEDRDEGKFIYFCRTADHDREAISSV